MRLTTYANAGDFLKDVRGYMERQEVVSSLPLGLAIRLVTEPLAYGSEPYFAAVTAGDNRPVLAALMTPPHNLILYSDSKTAEPEALELIAADLRAHGWPVPGVNGPVPLPRAFAEVWTARFGVAIGPGMSQRVHELRDVIPPRYSPGSLRLATTQDTALVTAWFDAFTKESLPNELPTDTAAMVASRIAEEAIFLWDDNGPASLAAKSRPTPHGISIGPVYTPPALRRRGYATSCVAMLSQRLLDSGFEYVSLFTDLANPTSNAIYRRIGYRPVCDFQVITFA